MADPHERVKRLFEAALQKHPSARADYLDVISDVDPDLRKEVESLLSAREKEDSFLEKTPPVATSTGEEKPEKVTAIRPLTETDAPERIRPYRLLRKIAEGGMGMVYEAEQEKPVRRRVALKLIKWGMDTKAVIGRFESERQALALMNHPNIASVFDAGATPQGRPYFAMEYVQGIPITAYCDKHRLPIKDRLQLFVQVCEGVQHAHQKGIIHRDIKPSNVLVAVRDNEPVPKIIDFGVAKATSQRLTEHTVATELGQLTGTPEYMSPEQAEMTNLDIDTRTDVYSLGVLLYELLVGALPFDPKALREAGPVEVQRWLREDEPPRPSTRVSSLGEASSTSASNRGMEVRTLEKQLRGDLDWITMKALEKDRTHRYETANALGLDVEHYLHSEPIRARAPSPLYRASKFVRRHRVGVGAASVLILLLTAFSIMMLVQSTRIARERDRAEGEASKAMAINGFLQETLSSTDPYGDLGRDVTVAAALAEAVGRIEKSFRDQPEIEAAVKDTIGMSYKAMGRYEDAESLLISALELRKAAFGAEHVDVAESLQHLGELQGLQRDFAHRGTTLPGVAGHVSQAGGRRKPRGVEHAERALFAAH